MKQQVWHDDDRYVVLTHVGKRKREDDPIGRWELELTERVEVDFRHGAQSQDDTIIEYHRTWVRARYRAWCFMQSTHVTVSYRTVNWILRGLLFVGLLLAVTGLRAAYDTVGFQSAAGLIITITLVVETATLAGALWYVHYRLYSKEKK